MGIINETLEIVVPVLGGEDGEPQSREDRGFEQAFDHIPRHVDRPAPSASSQENEGVLKPLLVRLEEPAFPDRLTFGMPSFHG